MAVWVQFWRTPAWASGSTDVAVWAANPKDLEDFAFAVATRYPQVQVFMSWNEPNLKSYAKPNTIAAYEPMARAVYAGVKAANPSAEVVGGNLGKYRDNGRDPALWAATLRSHGVPMDAFGINPYPDAAKPLAARAPRYRIDLWDVPALARIAGVPVAVTEFGWSSMLAGAANQATWTAQAIDVARCTPGRSQFVFWGYHDHPVPAGTTPDPWVTYGWLDATGAPKPVFETGRSALAGTPDCSTVPQSVGAPPGWPDTNTIPPTNYGPVCSDVALSSVSGGSAAASLQCTDAESDTLSYSVTTPAANGTVAGSGSVFTYTPRAGFTGSDAFTVTVRDGINATPLVVGITVTAPVTTPPAATVDGPVTVKYGLVWLGLRCASAVATCTGSVRLSATLNGTPYSFGSKSVSLKPGQKSTIGVSIPASTNTALRAYAGKTIALNVAFVTTSSNGAQQSVTTTVNVAIPR